MKVRLKISAFLLMLAFCCAEAKAQTQCKVYACFLCQWGGEFKLEVPNIFSPNGDFVNDVWTPKLYNESCLDKYQVNVYNRWGKQLFESAVYSVGWNGNEVVSGDHYPEGIYYYVITYSSSFTGESKTLKGYIQLVR